MITRYSCPYELCNWFRFKNNAFLCKFDLQQIVHKFTLTAKIC